MTEYFYSQRFSMLFLIRTPLDLFTDHDIEYYVFIMFYVVT